MCANQLVAIGFLTSDQAFRHQGSRGQVFSTKLGVHQIVDRNLFSEDVNFKEASSSRRGQGLPEPGPKALQWGCPLACVTHYVQFACKQLWVSFGVFFGAQRNPLSCAGGFDQSLWKSLIIILRMSMQCHPSGVWMCFSITLEAWHCKVETQVACCDLHQSLHHEGLRKSQEKSAGDFDPGALDGPSEGKLLVPQCS